MSGLKDKRPILGKEEQVSESQCDEQSFENYYSSQECEEAVTDSEEEQVEDEGNDNSEMHITRSERKSRVLKDFNRRCNHV
jgi:hypothetical protein